MTYYRGPYMPNIDPFVMPASVFNRLLLHYGVKLAWRKSHTCPCLYSTTLPGSADPQCQTCQGRGIYWDPPTDPFMGLLTWRHMSPTPDEAGAANHEEVGLIQHGEPTLTIPYTADPDGIIWQQATLYDAFIEIDALDRFVTNLQVSGITAVPYQQGLTIAASGAVTVYDPNAHMVDTVTGYTVSGANVLLPGSYEPLTNYVVEYLANPVFVAFRKAGGLPMTRPFGSNPSNLLPRRFRVQTLDLWLRARQYPGDASPNGM